MPVCVHAAMGSRLSYGGIFWCCIGLERSGAEGELVFRVAVFGLGYAGVARGWGAGGCHCVESLPAMEHGVVGVVVKRRENASLGEVWLLLHVVQ